MFTNLSLSDFTVPDVCLFLSVFPTSRRSVDGFVFMYSSGLIALIDRDVNSLVMSTSTIKFSEN